MEVLKSAERLAECHETRPDFFYQRDAGAVHGAAGGAGEAESVRRQRGRQPSTNTPYSPHGAVLKRPKGIGTNLERLSL